VGTIILSQTAFGFTMKNPQKVADIAKDTIVSIGESADPDTKYDVKMHEKKVGGIQNVEFKFLKNGKLAGTVSFVGTESDMVNSVKAGLTNDGKDDAVVKETAKALFEVLQEKINKVK
jgi:hypothetical protein